MVDRSPQPVLGRDNKFLCAENSSYNIIIDDLYQIGLVKEGVNTKVFIPFPKFTDRFKPINTQYYSIHIPPAWSSQAAPVMTRHHHRRACDDSQRDLCLREVS